MVMAIINGMTVKTINASFVSMDSMTITIPMSMKTSLNKLTNTLVYISFKVSVSLVTRVTNFPTGLLSKKKGTAFPGGKISSALGRRLFFVLYTGGEKIGKNLK